MNHELIALAYLVLGLLGLAALAILALAALLWYDQWRGKHGRN